MALLAVEDLAISFRMYGDGLRRGELRVIDGLTLAVEPGQIVAVLGASGSGKSLLAHGVMGLLPANAGLTGRMLFRGEPLTPERQERLRGREIALIPQTVASLDPLMRVGAQVRGRAGNRALAKQREIFARYGLGREVERLYPHQLSGGMARRVLVAAAAASEARLILADEPTPGLDPSLTRETVEMFRELAAEGRGLLVITHDIDFALAVADAVAVLYAGRTVELAPAGDFAGEGAALRHPYTRALYRALPRNGFRPLPGAQPYAGTLPPGCPFAPRCPLRGAGCGETVPLRELRHGKVRCVYAT